MDKIAREFINQLNEKKSLDCKEVAKAVNRLLDAPSHDEVINRLIAVSRELDDNTLGYFVFPGLRKKVEKDKALLIELQKLVQRRRVPINVQLHCIELIDRLFREKKIAYPRDYADFICETAANPSITITVRAWIARLLYRVKGGKQYETLRLLIDSKKAQLVESACHTMSRWSKEKLGKHRELVKQIMSFAQKFPVVAVKNPNILRTLSRSSKRGSDIVIDKVIAKTKYEDDWLRLAACIGPGSQPEQLAKIIKGVTDIGGPSAKIVIRNLFKKVPHQLELLYKKEFYEEFLSSITAAPTAIGRAGLSYLENIKQEEKSAFSKKAADLKDELTTAMGNAFLPKYSVLKRKDKSANPGTQPPNKQKIHNEFNTGFHMGDALYRDTYLTVPFTHNHWHAGIFQTLEFKTTDDGINGQLQGVHMTGFPGDVQHFKAQLGFGDPNSNVADRMNELYAAFLEAFFLDQSHDDFYYRGVRRTPDMSKDDRLELLATSENLVDQGIRYTFWDMLVQMGDNWDGSVSDISLLRCDGVIEYTYEKCGKKVCAGKEVSKWNIAAAEKACLESHEDLHTWNLNAGELCPKVQAGDSGNDTTFIEPQPSVPIVQDFEVSEESGPAGKVIAIKLNVQSNEYYEVFARITVGPVGGPFEFAVTGVTGYSSGISGQWMFKEVNEGTNHIAYWPSDTSGPNRSKIKGIYEFRLVAVDKGGNVSEEYSCSIPIDWS